ncbi:hypothetical protein [Thermaerobacter composti]|uniref:CdiI immunity protein domain-containing protein n=1 Tax=Thermaerobacter composti TaxID=554949 RepID=A0ABZ0QRR7_9FIRM|nr:hypothetical protein [Thermaerobacter composti]PZN07995.1 MAG: hypothetical protein DIU76_03540 [Bacillota bacterium]WPD20188.1 hypothetical protein Q5761_06040 [Thermaerobacter composti]
MAEEAERIALRNLRGWLDELEMNAADWETLHPVTQYAFVVEWHDQFLADVEDLVRAYREGRLTTGERRVFEQNMNRLASLKDKALAIDLAWPEWLDEFLTGYLQQAAAAGD